MELLPRSKVEESLKLYDAIKEHFQAMGAPSFFVYISDRPMSEWEKIPTPTYDEMVLQRLQAIEEERDFAGFYTEAESTSFYFVGYSDFLVGSVEAMD